MNKIEFNAGYLTIRPDNQIEYDVPLEKIKTEADLVKWIVQLTEKNWMSVSLLGQIIQKICDFKGWKVRGI